MKKLWDELINGTAYSLREKLFVLITFVMAASFAISFITNLFTGTTLLDVLVLGLMLAALIDIAVVSLKRKRLKVGAIIISSLLIFVLLPYTFFSGGGIYGGPPIWFIFSALFVSLILVGKTMAFFLAADLVVAAVCYILAYADPGLVHQNTTLVAYIDSYAALVFISLAVSIMVGFEILLYQRENKRAERQREEIQALNEAQSRFFSSMSHEIRTPINTIIGLNEMILREDVSREVAEDAANIQAASKILLHLVNDILDMSKLESGNMQLTPVPYQVADMVSELVSMFWNQAREKGLDFKVTVQPDVPAELIGDDVRIKQILINVLNNAVKYTREGSVTLSIQSSPREDGTHTLVYAVSDTGMGIKKESIPYLFTAFKRVDEEKNRHIEGTGLGLSVVKQLVELMGGSISVNSVYTQGSTFLIEIPQQAVGEATVGELDLDARRERGRSAYRAHFEAPEARVLVVDDNASNLLVVSKLLRDTKVQVDTASSGQEALARTLEQNYQVILMDHLMPEMDGLECRRRILAQPGGKCREAKIIILTANADGESRALYEREGFDGYLTKPLDAADLERELSRQLPEELVHFASGEEEDLLQESIAWIRGAQRKKAVAVTAESVADLPRDLREQYDIPIIPHLIVTAQGVFRDTLEVEGNGMLDYLEDPAHTVKTFPPDAAAYEAFFTEQLKVANNVLHIAPSSALENSGYAAALEAAASFNNVTVLDSGTISSAQGLMAMEASRLAAAGRSAAEIARELEERRDLMQTSFVADDLGRLVKSEYVGGGRAQLAKSLSVHPVLRFRKGRLRIGEVFLGSRKRTWKKYIASCFHSTGDVDSRVLFITWAGMDWQDLYWIREQAETFVKFDEVIYQKTSAVLTANCGPGSFGLMFWRKRANE